LENLRKEIIKFEPILSRKLVMKKLKISTEKGKSQREFPRKRRIKKLICLIRKPINSSNNSIKKLF
jgi:hypothetical protein